MKKQITVFILVVMLSSTFLFVGSVSAVQKNFTSTIIPTTAYAYQTQTYTITVADYSGNPSGNKLGSASVLVPTGFGASGLVAVTSFGATWTVDNSAQGVIKLSASSSAYCITPGQSVILTFTAVAPSTAGTYYWNTTAYTNPGWSGDLFSLMGGQPKVTVTQAYSVTFKYHASGGSPVTGPIVTYQHFGVKSYVEANAAASPVIADAGSAWTYANPIGVSSTERWSSTDSSLSGTVTASATIDPLYYHQFNVSFVVDPSSRAGTMTPIGSQWINAGQTSITAINWFGYTFSEWTSTNSLLSFSDSKTLTTTLTIAGSGTIDANFVPTNTGVAQITTAGSQTVFPTTDVGLDDTFGVGAASANTNDPIPPPPSEGFFAPGTVWSITTDAGFSGNVTVGIVVYIEPSSNTDPGSLRIWRADFPIGDVNFDGIVNSDDVNDVNKFYGTTTSSPNWNPIYDLNHDGIVNSKDVTICNHNYGETATWTQLQYIGFERIGDTNYYVIYASTDHFSGFGVH